MTSSTFLVGLIATFYLPAIPVWVVLATSGVLVLRSLMVSLHRHNDALVVVNFLTRQQVPLGEVKALRWRPYGFWRTYCKLEIVTDSGSIMVAAVSTSRSMGFEGVVSPFAKRRHRRIVRFFNKVGLSTSGLEPTC